MRHNESLIKGNVLKALLYFSLPVFFARLLQVLHASTGLFILGNFSTTADASGSATANLIIILVTMGVIGLGSGLTVVIGRYCGAGKYNDAAETIGSSIVFFLLFSAAVTILLFFATDPLIKLMNTPESAVIPARNYLRISASGIFFLFGYTVVGNICRGLGNAKAHLIFVAVAFIVNIGLSLLFISVFDMGAAGAALALVIAQGVSFFFALLYLRKKGLGFKFTRGHIKYNARHMKKMLKVGIPLSLQELLIMGSFMFITAVINKIGVNESAAVGFVEQLVSFLMIPATSVAAAVSAMSAHNIGAKEYSRAKKCMWYGVFASLAISVIFVIFCWFRGDILVALFTKDKDVIAQGFLYLKSYAIDCLFISFVFVMNGYFASCNYSLFAMAHSIVTTVAVRVPMTAFFAARLNATLFHMGLAAPISSVGSLILCLIFLRYLSKKQEHTPAPL